MSNNTGGTRYEQGGHAPRNVGNFLYISRKIYVEFYIGPSKIFFSFFFFFYIVASQVKFSGYFHV